MLLEAQRQAFMSRQSAQRTFPWVAKIGGASIALRLMTSQDRGAFQAFIKKQPEDDLFFLMKRRRVWRASFGESKPARTPPCSPSRMASCSAMAAWRDM